jgi:hypothetical protein
MKRVLGTSLLLLLMGSVLAFAQEKKDKEKDKDKDKDNYETVLKQMLDAITRASGALAKVKDDESAKAAKPELEKISTEMADVQQRALKLGKPSDEQSKALEKKYGEQLRNAVKELDDQALRLKKESYGKDLVDILTAKSKPKADDKDKSKEKPKTDM